MANHTFPNRLTVGLDIGYGVTKALTDKTSLLFPWGHAREIKFQAANLAEKYPGEQLSDDDGDWFIGELALSQFPVAQQLRLRGRTAHHDSQGNLLRLRLAKAAIGKLQPGRRHDVLHLRLSSGLPVDHLRSTAQPDRAARRAQAAQAPGAYPGQSEPSCLSARLRPRIPEEWR